MTTGETTRVVVSTECPRCGGPLDFAEGANAVSCSHCRSNLLVTGRKRVLSYWVRPTVAAAQAAERVRATQAPAATARRPVRGRIGTPQLFFVPYYRLTGHEFRWEQATRQAERVRLIGDEAGGGAWTDAGDDDLVATLAWAAGFFGQLLGGPDRGGWPSPPAAPAPLGAAGAAPGGPALGAAALDRIRRSTGRPLVFQGRYIDRSLLATAAGIGVESLGVRASVLRVELFRRDVLEGLGHVARVDVTPDAAVATGMRPVGGSAIVHRTVIGRVLSLIYFPFWTVPIGQGARSRLAVVDGVADTVVLPDASPLLTERLHRAPDPGPAVVAGFRPLVCPNCGWDLALRPDDVIFGCRSCARAWEIHDADFHPVPMDAAEVEPVPATPRAALKYLPCWVLDGRVGERATRVFSPAFRFRNLKLLADLASSLTRTAPSWTTLGEPPTELHGCHYDAEDAILLARFTQTRLGSAPGDDTARDADGPVTFTRATLTWFPFWREHRAWRAPFTGLAFQENGLI